MKLNHPAVTSDVFKLVEVLEFDLEMDGHFLPTRVELFRDTERKSRWRCRMWERELFHLTMTLCEGKGKKAKRVESDEELLIERTWELSDQFEDFEARDAKAAMKKFLTSLRAYLKRVAP